MSKHATLLLITVLALSSIVMVGSVFAESIPKPSVPEFNLKFVDNSYDVPPTYSTDLYTGETVMTEAGYRAQNISVEVTIENQPFTPYEDSDGNKLKLLYQVRRKPRHGEEWISSSSNGSSFSSSVASNLWSDANGILLYPDAPTTVFSFGFDENNGTHPFYGKANLGDVPDGGEIDFQVQAFIGYYTQIDTDPLLDPYRRTWTVPVWITGEASGWSTTQTIKIDKNQISLASPAPTSTPNQELTLTPEGTEVIIGAAITTAVICAGLGLLFYLIKRK
jgi:hypothetical protein